MRFRLFATNRELRAKLAEQEAQLDRADEHTAKIMAALEAAEAARDEYRLKWTRASDLASHNLDEREKLIIERDQLRAKLAEK